jgi:hypothetical protein
MEMIALQCKAMIVDNIIHGWARDLLEMCLRKVKKMRTEPEEDVNIIEISSDEEEMERSAKKIDLKIESERLMNTKLRGDCKFNGLASGMRLTFEAAMIIMEVHSLKKWKEILQAGDLIY